MPHFKAPAVTGRGQEDTFHLLHPLHTQIWGQEAFSGGRWILPACSTRWQMSPQVLAAAAGMRESSSVLMLALPHTSGLSPPRSHLCWRRDGPCSRELFRVQQCLCGSQKMGDMVSCWLSLTWEGDSKILVEGRDGGKWKRMGRCVIPEQQGHPFTAPVPGRASSSLAMSEERTSELQLLHQHSRGRDNWPSSRLMVGGKFTDTCAKRNANTPRRPWLLN